MCYTHSHRQHPGNTVGDVHKSFFFTHVEIFFLKKRVLRYVNISYLLQFFSFDLQVCGHYMTCSHMKKIQLYYVENVLLEVLDLVVR